MVAKGRQKSKNSGQKQPAFITPQEEKRYEAIEKFGKAVEQYHGGDTRGAAKAFEVVSEDYADIIEVAAKAREYVNRCRGEKSKGKGLPAESGREELPETAECPGCGGALPVDSRTVSVWCTACEDYVHLA